MRYYLPGIGRFVSRVHLHEAVALGRTTYEELREEWGINIGPLGTPEAFARNEMPEHPYTYAENTPPNRADPAGLYSYTVDKSCKKWEQQIRRHMDAACGSLDACCLTPDERSSLKDLCNNVKISCNGPGCRIPQVDSYTGPMGGPIVMCASALNGSIPWWFLLHEMGHKYAGRARNVLRLAEDMADAIADACQGPLMNLPCVQPWFTGKSCKPTRRGRGKRQ